LVKPIVYLWHGKIVHKHKHFLASVGLENSSLVSDELTFDSSLEGTRRSSTREIHSFKRLSFFIELISIHQDDRSFSCTSTTN
jgi:hypothetical protein